MKKVIKLTETDLTNIIKRIISEQEFSPDRLYKRDSMIKRIERGPKFIHKYIKTLPKSNLKKGIDGYIYKHCKSLNPDLKHYYDPILYHDSVDTHGFNNISLSREEFFDTKPQIFITTNLTLNNLGFNPYTKFKIKKMKDLLETNKLLLIQLNPLFFITHLLKKIKTHRWFITFKWKIFNS
jgi:hypothetical protein